MLMLLLVCVFIFLVWALAACPGSGACTFFFFLGSVLLKRKTNFGRLLRYTQGREKAAAITSRILNVGETH